ncbi:MAG: acyltransferase [Clostridia bacterium]|nr:acyltransferase [Clostridia bacterium]
MNLFHIALQINIFKTLYANFKLFPMKTAIRLPIIIGNHVKLDLKGKVIFESNFKPKTGTISFGIGGSNDLRYFNSRRSYFGVKKNGVLKFQGKAHFAVHTSLLVSNATMIIGNKFSCNNGTKISCVSGIEIGDNCLIGTDVLIMDSDGHDIYENSKLCANKKDIKIGNHCWLTSKVSVLKGTYIADDIVVALGSIVTKDLLESKSICAGIPARTVKKDITWER